MAYIGTTINQSPTIAGKLAAAITGDASFLAVKFDSSGAIAVAGASDVPVGFIIPGHAPDLKAGDEVTIQIKDIGLALAGAAITAGSALAADANGKVIIISFSPLIHS